MKVRTTLAPILLATASFSFFASTAAASEIFSSGDTPGTGGSESVPTVRPGFGARVGGYGFREADGAWTDCRMGGVGIFGTLDVHKYFFLELGLDSYQAQKAREEGMDRVSVQSTVAAGLRMWPDFYLSPYVQLGLGVEWTRVDMVMRERTSGVFPLAFLGVGAELHVFRTLSAGAVLRVAAMAHPTHDGMEHELVFVPGKKVDMTYEPASQGLFYLRYAL